MSVAVFFQKRKRSLIINAMYKLYTAIFLRTNKSRIKYLRDAGAKIGESVRIQRVSQLGTEPFLVTIGDNVYFSGDSSIITHDGAVSKLYDMGIADKKYDMFGRVTIGENCFIGASTTILKGVTIGDNCIIGAGSIVTKDIPSNSVACGIPAKVISTPKEYYLKNKENFVDTHFLSIYEKRKYFENHFNTKENV